MAKEKLVLTKQRLDTWLWTARFFKTRRLATEAISGGKVRVNDQRSKASKEVRVDDILQINKTGYSWEITILGLNPKRRPAKEAVLLYSESESSSKKRHELIAINKDIHASAPQSERPNKKQRRQIHRFKQVT